MIEVIDAHDDTSPSVEETVEAALEAIVQHYGDPVHKIPEIPPNPCCIKSVPPVVQHWMDRLKNRIQDGGDFSLAMNQFIDGYTKWIRPNLFYRQSLSLTTIASLGIPILMHYELLLSNFLETEIYTKGDENSSSSSETIVQSRQHDKSGVDNIHSLDALASDIGFITKCCVQLKAKEADRKSNSQSNLNEEEEEGPGLNVLVNVTLPAVVRVVMHCLSFKCRYGSTPTKDTPGIRKCLVSMLAFGNPRIDPRDVVLGLETSLLIVQEDTSFLYVPVLDESRRASSETPTTSLNLGSNWAGATLWDPLRLNGTSWEDQQTGITGNAVNAFWRSLHSNIVSGKDVKNILEPETLSLIEVMTSDEVNNKGEDDKKSIQSIIRECLEVLSGDDPADFAKAIRAHFFGRDVTGVASNQIAVTPPATRLHLGRVVEVREKDTLTPKAKAYREVPSRVHVAMHYILLLQRNELTQKELAGILEEILPIVYELISANAQAHIAMGASALIHLLSLTIPSGEEEENTYCRNTEFVFAQWAGTLLPVLDMACQVCREGAPFVLLARAQSLLCWISSYYKTDPDRTFVKHRRRTTRYLFTVLDKHNHKVSDPDGLLWALLVGGVLPLLHQHATVPEAIDNVDCMEMGRLGLTALLPIVRYSGGWSSSDASAAADDHGEASAVNASRKLLAPSVLALVYLLRAAYPIMSRHGGKIMSELMALAGNLQRQDLKSASDLRLLRLIQDAAGIALVVCGERADEVLDLVVAGAEGNSEFEPGMVKLAEEVRRCAEQWKQAQQKTPLLISPPTSATS